VSVVAVVPVREGELSSGGLETAVEAGGRVVLVGSGARAAAPALTGHVQGVVRVWDTPGFAPGAWAEVLAPLLRDAAVVLLPASPDGRDLAPRLAAVLGRPLLAGAVEVGVERVSIATWGGRVIDDIAVTGPVVVTLQPGVRGVEHPEPGGGAAPEPPTVEDLHLELPAGPVDATLLEVLPPDVATMDLAEAPRILGGGAGLGGADDFVLLTAVAVALGASMGATRVVTDAGWVGHERQIGTTGVVVDPRLYVAFGISGAVQHTSGLGDPQHVVSVNLDPHCPMMTLADLAVVADASAVLRALADQLGLSAGSSSSNATGEDGDDA
jgi:electron transfer flavoprotein alpha subunit